jgi:GT2 family glycosyltransferase
LGSKKQVSVSIVLVTHNGTNIVEECLNCLRRLQWSNLEIIVVDNASIDDTLEHVQRTLPTASILRLPRNRGYGAGCNEGARVARGEILLFVNQDVAVSADFLDGIVSVLNGNDKIGVCGGTVLSWDGKMLISIGQVFERWTGYGLDVGFGSSNVNLRKDVGEVFSPNGSAFAVRTNVFHQIGGFDESMFMYFDETDLSWRARMAGFRVACSRRSIVRHMITPERAHRASSRYYIDRNSLLSAFRNYEVSSLIRFLPTSIGTRLAAVALFTVFGRRELAHSVFRALADFTTRLPKTWKERRALSRIRRVSDMEVMRREVLAKPSDVLSVFSSSLMPHTRE